MSAKTLQAHFDGKHVQIDEPFELKPNTKLIVTVLPSEVGDEREFLTELALSNLGRAYGNEESEYSLDSITEANPEYEGR